jgi:hypothetical protein
MHRPKYGRWLLPFLAAGTLGCSDGSTTATSTTATSSPSTTVVDECVPTVPNGEAIPGEPSSEDLHGDGQLVVALWPSGVVLADEREDGYLTMKFPWWRGPGVVGRLTLEVRRVDADETRQIEVSIPDGYGYEGFQATSIAFPAAGCYEIVGRVLDDTLAVTVDIRRG